MLVVHGFPMVVLWGPDLIQIYNDGYRIIMGDKHPAGLGQPNRACWPEVWSINGPIYKSTSGFVLVRLSHSKMPCTPSHVMDLSRMPGSH